MRRPVSSPRGRAIAFGNFAAARRRHYRWAGARAAAVFSPPPFQGGGEKTGSQVRLPCMRTGGPLLEPIPLPLAEETGGGRARISTFRRSIPVYPGLSRSIPVYLGLSRFIPVDSGLSWSVPVYSGPSRPVPVAAGRKRMRSAERRVKGAARTAAPCRERRRVRGSPTPFGPRTVDGVHAPVDSIRSPPGQPRSSRAPGRPHLEFSGRRADAAIAGRGARGRHLLSSPLPGGEE